MVLDWTPWMLLAPLSSAVVGLLDVGLSLGLSVKESASVVKVMRSKPRSLGLIVGIDMIGGVVLAVGAVLFGVSNPANLVEFVGQNPLLGWIGIGAFGPLVGKRLIVGHVGRPEDVQEAEAGPARFLRSLAHVRRNALRLMLEAHFTLCARRDQLRLSHYRTCIDRLIVARRLGFDDLQIVVMNYLDSLKIAPPPFLEQLSADYRLREAREVDGDDDWIIFSQQRTFILASYALTQRWWGVLDVFCSEDM